jgi:oligogalacturonide lyase
LHVAAGYNLETHKRTAFHMQRNEWSIHFNLTKDLDLFTGDGGDLGQVAKATDGEWIELFHPQMLNVTGVNEPGEAVQSRRSDPAARATR